MLFIQLCNGVHQSGIIGMSAGAEIGVGTIEIILGLLLTLQDVLLHGVLQQGLDLIQECGPRAEIERLGLRSESQDLQPEMGK